MRLARLAWTLCLAWLVVTTAVGRVEACPFCQATQATFAQEFAQSAVVALVEQVEPASPQPERTEGAPNRELNLADLKKAKFKIVEFLKGGERLPGAKTIDVLYFGAKPAGTLFLVMGIEAKITDENASPISLKEVRARDGAPGGAAPVKPAAPQAALVPDEVNWSNPLPLTNRSADYFRKIAKLPADFRDRLAFFMTYFEDPEEILATDAYNEFALSKYEDLQKSSDLFQREKLLAWIKDPQIAPSHRRQYLSLLALCGKPEDVAFLEEMIRGVSANEATRQVLDSLTACYMRLAGPKSIDLIEELFLTSDQTPFSETYMAVVAIRFHGEQEKIIPKARLLKALRRMLDRAELADLVIPDLARWEDWESLETLVKLFKTADVKKTWVRAPIFGYLRVCPLPEAKKHLEELAKLDPETYKWAAVVGAFRPGQAPSTLPPVSGSTPAGTTGGPAKSEDKSTTKGASGDAMLAPQAFPRDPGPDPRLFPRSGAVAQAQVPAVADDTSLSGFVSYLGGNFRRALDWRLGGMLLCICGMLMLRRAVRSPEPQPEKSRA